METSDSVALIEPLKALLIDPLEGLKVIAIDRCLEGLSHTYRGKRLESCHVLQVQRSCAVLTYLLADWSEASPAYSSSS